MIRARRLVRIFSAGAGALLLLLIAPRTNPWQMKAVRLEQEGIAVDVFGASFSIAPWLLAIGLLLVLVGSFWSSATLRAAATRLRTQPGRATALFVALVVLLLTLIPTGRGGGVVLQLALGSAALCLLLVGLPLLRIADQIERPWNGCCRWFREMPIGWLLLSVFGFVFVATNLGSYFLFGHIPHIVDGIAQSFHGKVFLTGGLTAPPPPAGFFDMTHLIDSPRWYSQYPPGHSLLLAAGHLVGAPWLVNPLFGSLSVVLLYFIGREAYGEESGRLALLLGAFSPFLILVSSSFMNHTTTLFFLELFLLGFVRMTKRGAIGGALLAGFGLGYALTIRPLTALAFAVPFVLYAALRAPKSGGRFFLLGSLALAAFALPVAGLLTFNYLTNGDPFLSGYEVLHGEGALPGFGNSGWGGIPHTPARGLAATLRNANALNQYLFGLPFPSLAFALLGLAWRRLEIWDLLLIGSVASVAAAYFFYWYQDLALGPRFLYSAVAPLVLLSVRGVLALPRMLAPADAAGAGRLARALGLALGFCFVYAASVNVPALADYYSRNFADGNRRVLEAIEGLAGEEALLFVPSPYYPSLFPRNHPLLEGPVVYARDLGPSRNRELMASFPRRKAYLLVAGERYAVRPYDGRETAEGTIFAVRAGEPLTIEATTGQASHLAHGIWRNLKMGDYGAGWKNHDQLLLSADSPGAEVGFLLEADRGQARSIAIRLGKAPDFGIVTVALNRTRVVDELDLYSRTIEPTTIRIPDALLVEGANRLLIRVVRKNEASAGFGMGLDYLTLE